MPRFPLFALLLLVPFVLFAGENNAAKKEIEAVQGSWNVETLEYNGKDLSKRWQLAFIFKGDVASIQGNDSVSPRIREDRLQI